MSAELKPAVHPRGRGEQTIDLHGFKVHDGSSPRARGTATRTGRNNRYTRFIPAGAGNSVRSGGLALPRPVHPRGRGEQNLGVVLRAGHLGSSPRARGTGHLARHVDHDVRFIPAGAGNSSSTVTCKPLLSVHPRGRGEQADKAWLNVAGNGSSPRARGTEEPQNQQGQSKRFIPAGAGNRRGYRREISLLSVHPRGRGEQHGGPPPTNADTGSSPRARGTEVVDG